MKNFLHHLEYDESGISSNDIKELISKKKIWYDYKADQKQDKWNNNKKLEKYPIEKLPDYIKFNKDRFSNWID